MCHGSRRGALCALLPLLLLAALTHGGAAAAAGGAQRRLSVDTPAQVTDVNTPGQLVASMQCSSPAAMYLAGASWNPASAHYSGDNAAMQLLPTGTDPEPGQMAPIYKKVCSGPSLDFTFTAPPSCALSLVLYFKDAVNATGAERVFSVSVNDAIVADNLSILGLTGGQPVSLVRAVAGTSSDTGLVYLTLTQEGGPDAPPAIISAVQVWATDACPMGASQQHISVQETPGAVVEAQIEGVLFYRLACAGLDAPSGTRMDISGTLGGVQFPGMNVMVGSANATANDVFSSVCVPKLGMDALVVTLPLAKDITYEIVIWLGPDSSGSDLFITVDGLEVAPQEPGIFAPNNAALSMKSFAVRSENDNIKLMISSIKGFPRIYGIEAYMATRSLSSGRGALLDRPDDSLLVHCGAKDGSVQLADGEIAYPAPQAFTGVNYLSTTLTLAESDPSHAGMLAAGLFNSQCDATAPAAIVGHFDVRAGEVYNVTLFFVETIEKAAGARVMTVTVDTVKIGAPIDIFAAVGFGKTYQVQFQVTAVSYTMALSIAATVGDPVLNAILINGPGVDADVAELPLSATQTQVLFAVCNVAPAAGQTDLASAAQAGLANFTIKGTIEGAPTDLAAMYATSCFRDDTLPLTLAFEVPIGAALTVRLHFAEPYYKVAGGRVMQILVDGVVEEEALDLFAEAGLAKDFFFEFEYTAYTRIMRIDLVPLKGQAMVNGVQIFAASGTEVTQIPSTNIPEGPLAGECAVMASVDDNTVFTSVPPAIIYGEIDIVTPVFNYKSLTFINDADAPITITSIACTASTGTSSVVFAIEFEPGVRTVCGVTNAPVPLATPLAVPSHNRVTVVAWFDPTVFGEQATSIVFNTDTPSSASTVFLQGQGFTTGVYVHTLHPIIVADDLFLMPNDDDYMDVLFDGTPSHDHDTVNKIKGYTWSDISTGQILQAQAGTLPMLNCSFGLGVHTVALTLFDTGTGSLAATHTITVAHLSKVQGTLVRLYANETDPANLPPLPSFAFLNSSAFQVTTDQLPAGYTDFTLQMIGRIYYPGGPGQFQLLQMRPDSIPWFAINGEFQSSLDVDMPAGYINCDLRYYMAEPYSVGLNLNGRPVDFADVDLSEHPPIINSVTPTEVQAGTIGSISGFLLDGTTIMVGDASVTPSNYASGQFSFLWPNVTTLGPVPVTVVKGGLVSNVLTVTYTAPAARPLGEGTQGGPFAVQPQFEQTFIAANEVARIVYCHGKFYWSDGYVGTISEMILDDTYALVSTKVIFTAPATQPAVLGLACDPRDNDATFRLYFSASKIFAYGGKAAPTTKAPYLGSIYYIQPNAPGPMVATLVVDSLTVSGTDHAVNGIAFRHDGKMIVTTGTQTNAGIVGPVGYMPDNPSGGAVLEIDFRAAGFAKSNAMAFLKTAPATVAATEDPMDQRFGDWTYLANPGIKAIITGVRNCYGVVISINDTIIMTNNGPNVGYGDTMVGLDPTTGEPVPGVDITTRDSFWMDAPEGCHFGHPSAALCRAGNADACIFQNTADITGECEPTEVVPVDVGGVGTPLHYLSYAFGGAYFGHVFFAMAKYSSWHYDPTKKTLQADTMSAGTYPKTSGIHYEHAPGGVHLVADFYSNKIWVNKPSDAVMAGHSNPSVYDILPTKALQTQTGPNTFTIGGDHFDAITGPVTVLFGDVPATDVVVQGVHWIKGSIPSSPAGACPTDVFVLYGTTVLKLPSVFCYLTQ